jgi:predicted SnoaL-like aldol condensation-catalyzing enzyme
MIENKAVVAAVVGLALLGSAMLGVRLEAATATRRSPTQHSSEEANKKLAAEFFRPGITPQERLALIHPDYVQHDPIFKRFNEVNHLDGKPGFEAMIKVLRATAGGAPPVPPAGNDPTFNIVADGDIVTVIQKRYLPDPANPGAMYESFYFETWRIKDGKLYEHWDPATLPQPLPDYLKYPQPIP